MYKLLPILLFAYGLAITTEDIYDNSYALIIGIDKYENVKNLNYAVADAESIQDILVNTFNFPEGNITLLKNEEANKQAILKAFSDLAKTAENNDRVLIYFAGHGKTLELTEGGERGYLLPVDGNEDLYLSSIGMDELEKLSEMSRAKHMLYLVDACYGGLAAISSRGSRGLDVTSTPNYIEKITRNRGVQIITAGGKDEEVQEKAKWGASAFTLNLKRGLKDRNADMNSDGYITANELGMFLSEKVTIDSDNQQTPQYGRMTSQEGEFVFVYSENTAVIQDKSTDEKLDLVPSDKEELKSQESNEKDNIAERTISGISRWRKRYSEEEDADIYGISYALYENNISRMQLLSTFGSGWGMGIGKISGKKIPLKRDITPEESISTTINGYDFALGYSYKITDELWLSAGGGIVYMNVSWQNVANNTSSKINKVVPIGNCGIGTRPFPSLMAGLYIAMNVSTIYSPQSYSSTNGIITINDYAYNIYPTIELGFLIPKVLFWPE